METRVKVYTAPGCPYCQAAKDFLTERKVDFVAHDVTADAEALAEMRRVSGGARSVPVISVCQDVMIGFDPERLAQMLTCLQQSTPLEV